MKVYIVKKIYLGYYDHGETYVELATLSEERANNKEDELVSELSQDWKVTIESYDLDAEPLRNTL